MIRSRSPRRLAALGLTLGLAITAIIGPATVLAAEPNWENLGVQQLPPVVSPGSAAGYAVSLKNKGPSNISQLYLFSVGTAPDPSYTSPSQGSCNASGPFFCDLGALRKGRTVTVIVAFPTPVTATGSFSVDFVWNTTGLGSGGGDQSHGDAIEVTGTTALSTDTQNFAGGFVVPTSDLTVANNQSIGSGNPQSTLVVSPARGIPVTVEDGAGAEGVCPTGFSCFSETSELHVGNGSTQYGQFMVVVQIDASQIPAGVNKNSLKVIHVTDDGTATLITANCSQHNPKADCKSVDNLPGGDLLVTMWLKQNGYIKFG
jgi:hypothetical protein